MTYTTTTIEMPKVYIVNLESYNNCEPIGAWFDLPVDYDDMVEKLQLDSYGNGDEEYAIHDYENNLGFEVSEYSSIDTLNEYAEMLEELQDVDNLEDLLENYSLKFVHEHYCDMDFIEARSQEDLAYEVVEMVGGIDGLDKETLLMYFDYEAFGRDLVLSGDYSETSNGFVRSI